MQGNGQGSRKLHELGVHTSASGNTLSVVSIQPWNIQGEKLAASASSVPYPTLIQSGRSNIY